MIVNNRDIEFESDTDLFSLAGRIALVGGGAYAIGKTSEDFSKMPEFMRSKRSDTFKVNASKLLASSAKALPDKIAEEGVFFKSKFLNFADETVDKSFNFGSLDDIKKLHKGGFQNQSKDIPELLDSIVKKWGQIEGEAPALSYRMDKTGKEITYIGLKGKDGFSLGFPTVLSGGDLELGSGSQNKYMTRAVHSIKGGELKVYGEDVGFLGAVERNMDKLLDGSLDIKDIKAEYQKVRQYSDKNYGYLSSNNSNPELRKHMQTSSIEDVGLKFSPGGMMDSGYKKQFMIEQARLGRTGSSPMDVKRGVILGPNSPMLQPDMPFFDQTANPKAMMTNVRHVTPAGISEYQSSKNTLFLGEEPMQIFKELQAERGNLIGQLGEEELLLSKRKAGSLIDTSRSISVSSKAMTKSSEYLFEKIAAIAGKTPEEVSLIIKDKGLSGFGSLADDIRNISLDDYRQGLISRQNDINQNIKQLKMTKDQASIKGELASYNKEKAQLREDIKGSDLFGKKGDLVEESRVKKTMRNLKVQEIYVDKNGVISVRLRREKTLGPGDKIKESGGETKSIIKNTSDKMGEDLIRSHEIYIERMKTKGISIPQMTTETKAMYMDIDFIANKSAMKTKLDARNAFATFNSVFSRAYRENNQRLIKKLEGFSTKYSDIPLHAKRDIFKTIKKVTGQSAIDYAGQNTGFGTMKTHFVAYGETLEDMGAGAKAGFSKRDIFNFQSFGLKNFSKDIMSRRLNPNAVNAAKDLEKILGLAADSKYKGGINFGGADPLEKRKLINTLFPALTENNIGKELDLRKKRMALEGIKGSGVIQLGREIEGVSSLPLLQDDFYRGLIGPQIGSSSKIRSYASIDKSTKQILVELSKDAPNEKTLRNLMIGHKQILSTAQKSLLKSSFKDKITDSYRGVLVSAPAPATKFVNGKPIKAGPTLDEYVQELARRHKTKGALPTAGVMPSSEFKEIFGKDEYSRIMKSKGKFVESKAWMMFTRYPVEGNNHLPLNMLPDDYFGSKVTPGGMAISIKEDKNGYQILKSIFGDLDGDQMSGLASTNPQSTAELRELALGNTERSVMFRESMKQKGSVNLKGADQMDYLKASMDEIYEAGLHAKYLEKVDIGVVSKTLEMVHNANYSKLASEGTPKAYKKFMDLSVALNMMAEHSIKGKKQNLKSLREGKTLNMLNALTGGEGFITKSVDERKGMVLNFLDELALQGKIPEENMKVAADQLRQASIDGDELRRIEGLTLEDSKKIINSGWFKDISIQGNVDDIFDSYKKGIKMGSPDKDILQLSLEDSTSDSFKKKMRNEKLTSIAGEVQDVSLKGAKNIAKYALAPMAVIGLAGTLFGGTSKLEGDKVYSDGSSSHYKGGDHQQKPRIPSQMRRPKYERWSISGESSQQRINYDRLQPRDKVHVTDHTRNFDKYEIQEMVERGI